MNDDIITSSQDLILLREQKIEQELLAIEDYENHIEKIESIALELDSIVKEYIKNENICIAEYLTHNEIFDYIINLELKY
jgi:hypothetical protein